MLNLGTHRLKFLTTTLIANSTAKKSLKLICILVLPSEHCAPKEEDEQTVVVVLKFASTMFDRTSEPTTLAAF